MLNDREIKRYFEENGSYSLLKTLIEVLEIFHLNSLYHGGIKLSNIMLKEDGYEICDYFYNLLNDRDLDIISKKDMNYLSPEELLNNEINEKKDIWNVGILFYKILSGKFPFEGKTIIETCNNIIKRKFSYLNIEYSELLNPLINKLLKKKSKNRISILEFEEEIDKINSFKSLKVEIESNNEDISFFTNHQYKSLSISEDGKTIGCKGLFTHCNLNVKMSKDVHHFIFKILNGCNRIFFGCSRNNYYYGNRLYGDKSSCSILLWSDCSELYGKNGKKMKECSNDITGVVGEEYEVIFNMDDKLMSIKQGKGDEILLFKYIKTPVYPFVYIFGESASVSLINYWIGDILDVETLSIPNNDILTQLFSF